jgi:hypothetical protein
LTPLSSCQLAIVHSFELAAIYRHACRRQQTYRSAKGGRACPCRKLKLEPETSAMPWDHGRRLENCQRVTHAGHQAIEASESEPIDVAEEKALRRPTPKHIDLMAKNENFALQRRAEPEQPCYEAPKQSEEVDHLHSISPNS